MIPLHHPIRAHVGDTPVTVALHWCPSDPMAVRLLFDSKPSIDWRFHRDLMEHGVVRDWQDPAGIGDVRVWADSDSTVCVELDSPNGSCTLLADRWAVLCFVAEVMTECPADVASRMVLDAADGWLAKEMTT